MTRSQRRWPLILAVAATCAGLLTVLSGIFWARTDYQLYSVTSDSMAPTLTAGQDVLARSDSSGPQRGDIVVVSGSAWNIGDLAIKRVIGVGGDQVACCADGKVTVNGKPFDEPDLGSAGGGLPGYSVTVPQGRLFLLGDNRQDSIDSRMFLSQEQGTLPVSAVRGRVVAAPGFAAAGALQGLVAWGAVIAVGVLLTVLGPLSLLVGLLLRRRRGRAAGAAAVPAAVGGGA